MADHVPISLNPAESRSFEPVPTLGQQISRITHERGSFGNLSEAELTKEEDSHEVSGESNNFGDNKMDVDQETYDEGLKQPSVEELRTKLVTKIGAALNETALNLDFVSLLVSASRPQAGESSISPMLKSQTPLASLNAQSVTIPAATVPATSSYGWKVKAYRRSATSLSNAAQRLTKEADKEKRFWHDLLDVTSQGEVVNRKLRVTYGYRDSGSLSFDKGHGSFKREESSGAAMFKPYAHSSRRLVRVTVIADGSGATLGGTTDSGVEDFETPEPERIVGQSTLPFMDLLSHLKEPLRSVRVARNNLYEHELMWQLIKEARGDLASHRVKLQDGGKIICELFGGRIEIDLADAGAELVKDPLPLSNPAQSINYTLHLLLSHQYQARLRKSHDVPRVLASKATIPRSANSMADSEAALEGPAVLQPVLAHIHHSVLVSRTLKLIQVMLPGSEVSVNFSDMPSICEAPVCKLTAVFENLSIEFIIRSPISIANEPMATVTTGMKSIEVFDLTELELWLKWVAKLDR